MIRRGIWITKRRVCWDYRVEVRLRGATKVWLKATTTDDLALIGASADDLDLHNAIDVNPPRRSSYWFCWLPMGYMPAVRSGDYSGTAKVIEDDFSTSFVLPGAISSARLYRATGS